MRPTKLALRIWFLTASLICLGLLLYILISETDMWMFTVIPGYPALLIGGTPALIILLLSLPLIRRLIDSYHNKIYLVILTCGICAVLYGLVACLLYLAQFSFRESRLADVWQLGYTLTGSLLMASLAALGLSRKQMAAYFEKDSSSFIHFNNKTNMETFSNAGHTAPDNSNPSNKILIKGAITAALIGVMMIPTVFISDLVRERKERNEAVVKEVDSRWASSQTLTGPFIYLPYRLMTTDGTGKMDQKTSHVLIIPENKDLNGTIQHELRERSIYKVLLYRASLTDKGNFVLNLPKEINPDQVVWTDAEICFGISDFKGIEEKLMIRFNGTDHELSPGLPVNDTMGKGLSAPIMLSAADLGKPINYAMDIKIKGSEQLHFVPLSGNSHFSLASTWPNPSFDGSNLPSKRLVNENGFTASWNFNKANLPFGTVLNNFQFDASALAFGVTMVEPADQYAKTNRSIKYAILIIGLTFSLFFIIELMQRKPIHPVQYVLIGLALVIFYSLLLAISEFLAFDYAYLIAAIATIVLIGLYAKSHFRSWTSSGIFSGVLTLLYGFIFVLIRLEDTALLVGSIGLFVILALTMYASKKVNWYGQTAPAFQ